MDLQLMRLEIHLGLKHHEFLLQTFLVWTQVVIPLEVIFKGVIIDKVLLLTIAGPAVADMASFMPVSAVGIELIISIESYSTEPALWMASETALVSSTGIVVPILLMFSQLGRSK